MAHTIKITVELNIDAPNEHYPNCKGLFDKVAFVQKQYDDGDIDLYDLVASSEIIAIKFDGINTDDSPR